MEILGIDIGGSGIKGAIVNTLSGEMLYERHRIETPQPASPEQIAAVVGQIQQHFNWTGRIGCGFPAVVQKGVIKTAANIAKSNIGVNAEELFSRQTNCEVKVVNDADAAGIAEAKFGGGKGISGVVLVITIGTGIGSALIADGKLVPNTEFGHLYMHHGKIAERYTSDAVRKLKKLSWKDWGKRFNEYLKYLERTINPDLIILGGGAGKKTAHYLEQIHIECPVKPAELLNNAGIVGAALSASD